MQPDDVLRRYRELRAISAAHQSAALARLSGAALREHAKQLGMLVGTTIVADSEEEMTLVFDLAMHSARPGRSRAIDRYARAAALPAGSIEAQVLEAKRRARFSLWRVERRHDVAGLVVTDLIGKRETWLIDEGLTLSAEPGMAFASRLFWPAEFAMSCGAIVPVEAEVIDEFLAGSAVAALLRVGIDRLPDDPRFAAALYRAAIDAGAMRRVAYEDPLRLAC